jgi:chromosomal replication initiator protein
MSATTIWDQVLTLIEGKVGTHSFSTWFKPTTLKADEGRVLVVAVPSPLYVEWLPRHYSVVLTEALGEVGRPQVQLVFEVATATPAPVATPPAQTLAAAVAAAPPAQVVLPSPTLPGMASLEAPAPNSPVVPGGLNPRYTFDTFIVGPSNQFAHAACRAVAEASAWARPTSCTRSDSMSCSTTRR